MLVEDILKKELEGKDVQFVTTDGIEGISVATIRVDIDNTLVLIDTENRIHRVSFTSLLSLEAKAPVRAERPERKDVMKPAEEAKRGPKVSK